MGKWAGGWSGSWKGYREKVKKRESGVGGEERESENGDGDRDGEGKEGEDEEREAKRARVEEGAAGAVRTEGYDGAASFGGQQPMPPHPDNTSNHQMLTNSDAKGHADDDIHDDEGEDDGYDDASVSADGDETQPDEEDDPEDEEEPAPDEDELDGYGPEDQLRHDMNGDDTGDDSE
jgi:hypothetical protein